ncbi:MAG: phage tail sheath subtilisin-like domain-containing protein [Pseudomonadota bacterium]
MPEYLAPGVFVEEVSYRAKSIEGVSTTTTGFVGPTRYGPIDLEPEIITSLVEFERVYGGQEKLTLGTSEQDNYMWSAVRAFFQEGGKRLYVARVFRPNGDSDDGRAVSAAAQNLVMRARFPGAVGNGQVSLQFDLGQNRLVVNSTTDKELKGIGHGDIVHVAFTGAGPAPTDLVGYYRVTLNASTGEPTFTRAGAAPADPDIEFLLSNAAFTADVTVKRITASVFYEPEASDLPSFGLVDLALDDLHTQNGRPDSLLQVLGADPANASDARNMPIQVELNSGTTYPGLDLIEDFVTVNGSSVSISEANLLSATSEPSTRTVTFTLSNGNDGAALTSPDYVGTVDTNTNLSTGLIALENKEDISIVAAPGSSLNEALGQPVANALISHAQRMRYRIAVIDSIRDQSISNVRAYRALFDSKYAAFYYPWVKTIDPVTGLENTYPPSGFVAGIYARNDVERAVYKAPANEVVNLALGFEKTINTGQQEVLNPEGINCFRFFEGRGNRLWGARCMTSDPEWKYVNLRRYFAYLERSIDRGTQWAVFEPNGERLWANIRTTIEDFLLNEFQNGALLGSQPDQAFFVKCDRSTMTQNDIDNGRLVCQIGVAALKPAEFVIFRIGQWTADSNS